MCNFLSAIVSKNKEFYCNPFIDSHSELEEFFNIEDNAVNYFAGNYIKVEYTPKDNRYGDVENYSLKIDEDNIPEWCDDSFQNWIKNKMHDKILSLIVEDTRSLLIGGVFIVCDNAKVKNIKLSKILSISGSAQVKSIYDSAQVESISDSAQVESISGSAQVKSIYDSAQVESIYGSAQVKYIYGSAQVKYISGSAQVESISGSAQVKYIYDSAQVKYIYGSAKIINDKR